MLFLVVPTAGTREALLTRLIEQSSVAPEHTIIIATRENISAPVGCHVIQDFGAINIQRWWNHGIQEAVRLGATAVAVCNDDLTIGSQTLPRLHEALRESGVTIASPARKGTKLGLHKGHLVPYAPVLWGCLWVLDVTSHLRPDETFHWWYGDHDLDIRARRDYAGIVSVEVEFTHEHPGQHTGASDELLELVDADTRTYETKYSRLLWLTHMYNRFLCRGGRKTKHPKAP